MKTKVNLRISRQFQKRKYVLENGSLQKNVEYKRRVFNNQLGGLYENMFGAETNFILALVAVADLESSVSDKILFQITGFAIVLLALVMLWASVSLLGAVFSRFPVESAPAQNAAAVQPPIAVEHVAAIAAALHTVLREPCRIANIQEAPEESANKRR